MIVTLVKQHDKTKGPEQHQTWVFNLQSEEVGLGHSPTIFEYEGEKYRAFRTYAQVKPIVKDGKKYPVAQVVAVKLDDEIKWAKTGRQGKIAPGVLDSHVAK